MKNIAKIKQQSANFLLKSTNPPVWAGLKIRTTNFVLREFFNA